MSLDDWLRNGWLVEHETSPQEIIESSLYGRGELAYDIGSKSYYEYWRFMWQSYLMAKA